MTDARMSLTGPLAEGWGWMTKMLFRPFDIGKWFVVGFAAWLASLASGGGSNFGFNWDVDDPRDLGDTLRYGWDRLMSYEAMAGMAFAAVLTLIVLMLVVLWVSSRGKFIFLENVVTNRADIAAPWKRFRRVGNSLFLFRLIAGLLCVPLALGLLGLCAWLAFGPNGWVELEGAAAVAGIVGTAVLALVVLVTLLFVFFFLDAFVVPLMHRHDLGVMEVWRRFGGLFSANKGWFLLSGLFVFILCAMVGVVVMVTGFMTCCLGFLLLAVPYLSTVILLPLIITYRAFTVAFLAQVDPELALAATSEPAS